MPAAGRLGDRSKAPSDAHGCPACPHDVTGPAVRGSANVIINNKRALRVDDEGIHAACCGGNTWKAVNGSGTVFINGRFAHRKEDAVRHCGGMGNLAQGSPDVFIGEKSLNTSGIFQEYFTLNFDGTNEPARYRKYKITTKDGRIVYGYTDWQGRTCLITADSSQDISIELLD